MIYRIVVPLTLFAASSNSAALGVTSKVNDIGTGWGVDIACVYLDEGSVVRLDLTTEKGKAELAISLSAKSMNADLYVKFDETKPLVGGCNTGTTVMPHGIIIMR